MLRSLITRAPGLVMALLGALAALGQAPISLPWITLAALAGAVWLHLDAASPRKAARRGWLFGLGYFALALHWIVEPFFVDAAQTGWMAPFALVGMSGGLALFWALAAGLAAWLAPNGARGALAWVICLTGAELLRSYVLTGFPWALIGHVWIGWAPMQLAALVGPHGLTVLTLLCPAILVALWPRKVAVSILGFVGVVLFAYSWLLGQDRNLGKPPFETRPVVRLIQPNAPQHLKWDRDHVQTFFQRQVQFTAALGEAQPRPDLIVWPETAVPTLLQDAGPAFEIISQAASGVPVVLGIQRRDAEGQYYNSLVALEEGLVSQRYDKHHLVPFGEYMPLPWLFERINVGGLAARATGGYTAGPGARLVDLGPLGKALPLICYEAVFPQDVKAAPERPAFLLHITNDAWFGEWVGPYQHLAQARLRAVEQGLPLLRAANTGVSAVIDPNGRVVAQLGLNEAGFLDAVLPAALRPTLYSRTGDLPATLTFLLVLAAFIWTRPRKQH